MNVENSNVGGLMMESFLALLIAATMTAIALGIGTVCIAFIGYLFWREWKYGEGE